jgi:hypothetical protein
MTALEYSLNNESPALLDVEAFTVNVPEKCGCKVGDFGRHVEKF